ncbi:NDP-hexose 2,3-dehydratase family protein [Micromonospora ureilytica]|uniref:NDP-hexose 2,3-dehydratase family protein n=1 Tax=Micromonospora ureilytica TaxID=709868 RepID=UPI0033F02824
MTASLAPSHDERMARRLAASAQRGFDGDADRARFHDWFADVAQRIYARTEPVPLDALTGWVRDPGTGDIRHNSNRFFTIEGVDVTLPSGPVTHWDQPIINQPEVGILGILIREIDGVPHLLMQAKVEPGNRNGVQLAPTVQATRSNYTRVHGGRQVPYLEYFRVPAVRCVVSDRRQSEQAAWFLRKRNRNMVVETTGDVPVQDGFRWLTLGQVHELLAVEDLINMDARTVLSCLPAAGVTVPEAFTSPASAFAVTLRRSLSPQAGARHTTTEILSWMTEVRTATDLVVTRTPVNMLREWRSTSERISHHTGRYFSVIGVEVVAGGREVARWCQPMIAPVGVGVIGLVVRDIGGVLHALMQACPEPGYVDVAELAPTVQCIPGSYDVLPGAARPPFLDLVLGAAPEQIRFDTTLSEEGGRFFHALNRCRIVEADIDLERPDFRWVAVHQLADLVQHGHYLNVQARSMLACLYSLARGGR